MTVHLTAEQRAALRDRILDRLSGIDDVRLTIERGDLSATERLACAYSDELRLMCDDLGWDEAEAGAVELTAPRDVLQRVFSRVGQEETELAAAEAERAAEVIQLQERNRVLIELCRQGLEEIDSAEES